VDQSLLRQLFDEALAVDERDRHGWLDRACGDDADLRESLEGLLDAAEDNTEVIRATVDSTVRSLLEEEQEDASGDSGRYRTLAGWIQRLRSDGTTQR
jgi:hypothetical protein